MVSVSATSTSWQKNLFAVFFAELLVMTGFSFVFPFMPLYVQQVGRLTSTQAAFWAGIGGASGIAMFLSSPFWGILADRMGKKPMVLRAMFGSAAVVALPRSLPMCPSSS